MSYLQVESQVDLRKKGAFPRRHRRSTALTAAIIGTAIIGLLFVRGMSGGASLGMIEAPMGNGISLSEPITNSLATRGETGLSTHIEERGLFKWFIGVAFTYTALGIAFASLGPACVATGAPILIAGCVLGVVAAVATVVGTIQGATQQRKLNAAQSAMVYMGYIDQSARRSIDDAPEMPELDFDHHEFLRKTFGGDYQYAGKITNDSDFNRHLWERNGQADLPVFSFTTPKGVRLHHVYIENKTEGTRFHRFGFHPTSAALQPRQSSVAADDEYFTSGGIDALDCNGGDSNYLNIDDQDDMQDELNCAISSFNTTTEFSLQIYDMTNEDTIAAGQIAPVDANGTSIITQSAYTSCPDALTTGDSCGDDSASD